MVTTAKGMRAIASRRRVLCAGVVLAQMPFVAGVNVVVTRENVVEGGRIKRRKIMQLRPAPARAGVTA